MAWGYWTAHSLAPRHHASRAPSLSPTPLAPRSRDHSLDRAAFIKQCHAVPEAPRCGGQGCGEEVREVREVSVREGHSGPVSAHTSPGTSSGLGPGWAEDRAEDRTKERVRGGRARGGSSDEGGERHTLPRGGGGQGEPRGAGEWGEVQSLPRSLHKPSTTTASCSSETGAEYCPGCHSTGVSSRVSFHSVKESSSGAPGTGASSEQEGERERDSSPLLSSSLPTPPPPPFQVAPPTPPHGVQKVCGCGAPEERREEVVRRGQVAGGARSKGEARKAGVRGEGGGSILSDTEGQ